MKLFIALLGFFLIIKKFFFWLWLWQLKEYHLGRFKAHFETQKIKKILSSFWRFKLPRFTPKTIVISFAGIFLILWLIFSFPDKYFYFTLFALIVLTPLLSSLVVFIFQVPTVILRNRILKKAKEKRKKFKNLLVIGITGSYGKTSTKEFLAQILSEKYRVLKTKEHQNSEMGISRSILKDLTKEDEIFVVEMGAYNKGGIKLLSDIARPKIGLITGVNEQHLSTFGTMENLLSSEGGKELVESLSNNKSKVLLKGLPVETMVFLNAQNKYCLNLYQEIKNLKKFLYGQEIKTAGLENIEGAKAVARELGLREEQIQKACQKIENMIPGIEIKKGKNGLTVIDATYSANPTGVIAHLEYLRNWPNKRIIVMPCLIELGKASKKIHEKIGRKINEICDLAIIITKDRFEQIKEEAGQKAILIEKPEKILEKIKNFSRSGDVILLEGRVPQKLVKNLC